MDPNDLYYCATSTPTFSHFFNLSYAPSLLFYSYIPIIVASLFLGFFVFFKNKYSVQSRLLLGISVSSSFWIINIIFQWIAVYASVVYYSAQLTIIFEVLIFLLSIYFVEVFLNKKDISFKLKILLSSILIAIVIILSTPLNINSFDLINCQGNIGVIWKYVYITEIISIFYIIYICLKKYFFSSENKTFKKQILYFMIGVVLFLSIFSFSNIMGEITQTYEINLIGPIGMVIFLGLLSFMIVEYRAFRIKVLAVEALVIGLIFLIGSQFFFIKITTNFILNGITFVCVWIFGYMLIKSVKREIQQRERLQSLSVELEKSNSDLEVANEKLKGLDQLKSEFVSLASHQLRSPLTAIRGYTSMLIDGDYGEIANMEALGALGKISESSINLSKIVEDLLNVTKIEQGGMKYTMVSLNLAQLSREVTDNFQIIAKQKNLEMTFESSEESKCLVSGDKEKLRQVIINFIDNSIKYTKQGTIKVSVKTENNKVLFKIVDSGVGMNKEIKETLFHKFARGEGARMNTTGTGLGLYLCKEIAEAHGGRVYVESDGPGLGSTFGMELNEII